MGTKRVGLARVEALMENLKRELSMGAGSILSGLKGCQVISTARTATDDGTGTGTIADGTSFVTVNADADSDHILVLPTPTPGTIVHIVENGTTGYELRTNDPANVGINAGTAANAESAIAGATTLVRCVCVSSTNWVCTQFDADGDESKVTPASA